MAILRIKAGPGKGRIYEVKEQSLAVGRDVGDGIQVMDQGVSRRHAEIVKIGEMFFIRDLDSRNGTFVNEEAVKEEILRIGDQIRIGNTVLVFEDKLAHLRDSSRLIAAEGARHKQDPGSTIHIRLSGAMESRTADETTASVESKNLNVLFNLSYITSEEKDLSRLLNRGATVVGEALDADHVFVLWLKDEPGSRYDILGRFDRNENATTAACVSHSIVKDCIKFGRSILTSDATMDDQFNVKASVVMKQLRSVICVPVPVLGKNVGVLYVYSPRPEAFSTEALELATAVGIQFGTIVGLLKMVTRTDRVFRNSIKTIVSAIELLHPETRGKSERVAGYCLAMAKELGLETHEVRNAWLAGMLHDIGSIPLTEKEKQQALTLETRKNHYARELLRKVPDLQSILPAVEQQNERFDGTGSPEGKKGSDIVMLGRILGLALELDKELYHGSAGGEELTAKDALIKLRDTADHQFDREVVNALLRAYRNGKLFNPEEDFVEVPIG